jgi:hypothetical protein
VQARQIRDFPTTSGKSSPDAGVSPRERMAAGPPVPHKPVSLSNSGSVLAKDLKSTFNSQAPSGNDKARSEDNKKSTDNLLDGDSSFEVSSWKPLLPQR